LPVKHPPDEMRLCIVQITGGHGHCDTSFSGQTVKPVYHAKPDGNEPRLN
jgi:hypothetical protein